MYDNNGLTTTSLATALSEFSIAYINTSYSMENFDPMDAINIINDNFKPLITFEVEPFQSDSNTLYIRNIRVSKPGSVYFILTPYKKLIKNQIAGHSDIEIRPLIYPTA